MALLRHLTDLPLLRRLFAARGAVALASVIVAGAILLVVGISIAYIGQTEVILAGDADWSQSARYASGTCLEESLLRLKRDSAYTGGTLTLAGYTCSVAVSGSGSSRTITANATTDIYVKAISVTVSRRSNSANSASGWHIDTYQELSPP